MANAKAVIQMVKRNIMSEFRTVCRIDEVTEGEGKTIELDNKLIAVFLHQGQYYAIDDVCPHMGASLSGGYVEDGIVTCPWHAWRFRLDDGAWADYSKIKIGCYPVRVVGNDVQIQLNPPT
jgi:nitrite reductase (NADH) small subunit/3-phenylpropionate/trans-cinnamate dioxygenase ferredoxin subunit